MKRRSRLRAKCESVAPCYPRESRRHVNAFEPAGWEGDASVYELLDGNLLSAEDAKGNAQDTNLIQPQQWMHPDRLVLGRQDAFAKRGMQIGGECRVLAKRSKLPVASEKHVAEQSLSCGTETLGK
ncbi:MAG: hypothetical protein E6J71_10770 [Deltaproteobacteria bacterium]|nr:MAG: hypothetical protein E6J71_10770 [Deltaproteobacteria bacterium]